MAVKYVSEFSFPSEFGFHKSSIDSKSAKGMGAFAKSKAGPSVVTGNKRGTGGGHLTTGKVSKFATGGGVKTGWDQKKGIGKGGNEDRGIGTGTKGEKFSRISDTKSPTGSRHESGPKSGEAPRDDKRASFSKGMDGGYKKGGHIKKATTPQRYAKGGDSLHDSGCKCSYCGGGPAYKDGGSIKVAAGKVKDGSKTPWNKDDGVSPGSFKRTPPGEKVTNKKAAYDKFDAEGRNTDPATEQKGSVQRMSEFSDFKKGGKVHKKAKGGHATTPQRYAKGGQVTTQDRYEGYDDGPNGDITEDRRGTTKQVAGDGMEYSKGGRVGNLGKYAHPAKKGGHASGGDIKVPGTRKEVASGRATDGVKTNVSPGGQNAHYESAAGTPGVEEPGQDNYEMKSGEPSYSMGGLSRGANPKRMAAMHAKQDHKAMGQLAGVVGALSQPPRQPQAPGMGAPPPGMAPQMGAPPGMAGGVGRGPPPMAGGPPMASEGGSTMHIVHHHINHG